MGCTLLRCHRIAIHVFATPAFQRSDGVSANALGHKARFSGKGRIGAHGATVGAHGYAGHGFNTPGYHKVFPARCHFLCGNVYGLKTGGTKAIELYARDGLIPVSVLYQHFGDV